ncbi:SusC/RagA family TonB-linked outer membrane protein [Polaribacter sp. ALD11]|uniref:SusC/RagA family TonB-linked outer membrane protein n=1 Tax=Polaribacter sp. ALD11 TaxID=2058137 RepID=UPI000C3041C5|nr:SusC/RagA family TonB-linked outer membrane protein [Polaribacter sp. ALD11]AUC83798.1 SusC/RagA family TonB-linked outer membrane protein [Polaribacter sp. ALD11]
MTKNIQLTLLVFFTTSFSVLFSQNITVSGNVTDELNNGLPGVAVQVKGTKKGTFTDFKGNYNLTVEKGEKLIFSFMGYKSREIIADKIKINITLTESETALDEIVITAEFGLKRVQRSIGSSVQKIDGKTIEDSGRENFISALAGRVAGLNIGSTSGSPGASNTVILRNITSISGNNQPLYVVDGIPMNNSTFDPSGMAGGGFSVRDMDFSSRGNDFNPEDIESITVLKGAGAAALYGSDASNGAIIITTKKGTAGKGKVKFSNYIKFSKAYGYPEMQDKYANGAYGTTNYYFTSKFGGQYPEGTKTYDNIDAVLQTGFQERYNVSIEGGSEEATIRASFSQLNETGVLKTTDYSRTNLSLSGRANVTDWLTFEGALQYTSTTNTKVRKGTAGPLYSAMLWPMVDDMSNYLAEDGSHMRNPEYYLDEDLLNPLFGMNKNKYYDESDRFISNIALNITPSKNTFIRAQVGWDVGMQTFVTSNHPYYANRNAGEGQYNLVQSNFSDPTINILTGYTNNFFDEKFSFSGQLGYHQLENGVTRAASYGGKFIEPNFQSINNTDPLTQTARQRNTKRRVQGVSGSFEFGYDNIAFITLRARNDWSSTLPVNNNSYFYPALEGALIVSDFDFMKNIKPINYLKLRGSWAQVGKDARPLQIDPELQNTNLTGGGFKYGFTGPNPNLKPEITTAHEAGIDLRLFNNRVKASFTYFETENSDQIVQGFRLSYATGFVLNTMNVGTFKTKGWEANIDVDVIKTDDFTWNVGVNGSKGTSEVVFLPENVTEYYNPNTWNSGNIRNGIMRGEPITTLTGRAYDRNDNGDILISPTTGLPLTASQWSIIGDREPKLRFGVMTSLKYKNFRVSSLFAGRLGATVVNGTKRYMMQRGTSWESVALRERQPQIFNGVIKDGNENSANPTQNTISVDYRTYGSTIFSGGDEDWLEKDVNYLRMQEFRFSYRLPEEALRKTKILSKMDLFFVANDLFTWTNYSGIDAVGNTVSAAAGGTGGEGIDVFSMPNPRSFSIGLSLTLN